MPSPFSPVLRTTSQSRDIPACNGLYTNGEIKARETCHWPMDRYTAQRSREARRNHNTYQRARKFSVVLGTVSPKRPMTMRPASASPICTSKKTLLVYFYNLEAADWAPLAILASHVLNTVAKINRPFKICFMLNFILSQIIIYYKLYRQNLN